MSNNNSKNWFTRWLDRTLTVLGIVAAILIIGLVFYYLVDKATEKKENEGKEQKPKPRLQIVRERIKQLEPQKKQLEKREKKYFAFARLSIAILLITLNWLYLYFDNWSDFNLGDQLNINGAILLLYSFTAFLGWGNVSSFVAAIKSRATNIFLRKDIHVLSELKNLKFEEAELLHDLKETKKIESVTKSVIQNIDSKN